MWPPDLCLTPGHQRVRGSFEEEFYARIEADPETGCELWAGACDRAGYGVVSHDGRSRGAHRVAYELRFGSIPRGAHLHHVCRTTSCCRPSHLVPIEPTEHKGVQLAEDAVIAAILEGGDDFRRELESLPEIDWPWWPADNGMGMVAAPVRGRRYVHAEPQVDVQRPVPDARGTGLGLFRSRGRAGLPPHLRPARDQ